MNEHGMAVTGVGGGDGGVVSVCRPSFDVGMVVVASCLRASLFR